MHKPRRRKGKSMLYILSILLLLAILPLALGFDVRMPEATGDKVVKKGKGVLDISHIDQGYFMAMHSGSDKRIKVVVKSGKTSQNFDLKSDGEYVTFPLPYGSGKYTISINENVKGDSYTTVVSSTIDVKLADENLPFLYPNQYVDYDSDTQAVAKSFELCEGLSTEKDKANTIIKYVVSTIAYDNMRALQVKGNAITEYLPDIDDILEKRLGICLDYASLTACMLRAQGIPTKIIIGYMVAGSAKVYHAWVEVYINDKWQSIDPTSMASKAKVTEYVPDPGRVV